MARKTPRLCHAGRGSINGTDALGCAGATRTAAARSHHAARAAAGSCGRPDDRSGRRSVGRAVEDDGSQDHRSPTDTDGPARLHQGLRHRSACRRGQLRRLKMADDRAQGPRGTAGRRPGVVHLVPHQPDDPGQDRRLRHRRRGGRAARAGRRLRRNLGQRADTAPPGSAEPRHDPGLQHAKSRRAHRDCQGGDTFQIAVFGINGPISLAPPNTVWFREAKMEFIR